MKMDEQDELINSLYQQRKSSVVLPKVIINKQEINEQEHAEKTITTSHKTFSLGKLLIVILGGSCVSFSLFAFMSYLATSPVTPKSIQVEHVNHKEVEFEEEDLAALTKQAVAKELDNMASKLPALPQSNTVTSSVIQPDDITNEQVEYRIDNTTSTILVTQPIIGATLISQVVPEYPSSALINEQIGKVSLSYQLDNTGVVKNVTVVDTEGSHLFEKPAIKALSQWRYYVADDGINNNESDNKENDNSGKKYFVTFEFR